MNNMSSEFLKLNTRDYLHGLVMAILGAVLTLLIELLQTNHSIDWKFVGSTALIAALTYIVKKLGSDTDNKILGKI